MGWLRPTKKTGPKRADLTRSRSNIQAMRVSDYLSEKTIRFFPAGISLTQVLEQMIRSMDPPEPEIAFKAVMDREEAGATIIAAGLAIPHARLPGISRIIAALGICPTGILHPSGDQIRLFVLFLSPKEKMREHLTFLASVSSLFQTEGLMDTLLQLTAAEAVMEQIRAAEKNL